MNGTMWSAIVISQIILMPVLAILVWIYLRLRPTGCGGAGVVKFDAAVLLFAVLASLAGLVWVGATEIGSANRIWKPVLSIITTFHIFPLILCLGWLLRRRLFPASAA